MSGEPHACPSPDRFLALLEDSVAEPDRSRDLDHIRDCPRCSAAFSRMADSWSLSDLACADTAVGRDTLAFERRLRALRAEPRPLADDVCEETPAIPGYDGISLHSWGGMATIYRARDTAIGRPVAIKLLSSHAIHGKAGRHRALREARLLARLAHPGVVAIHATGIWRDRPYLVLEWIDGCTLQDRIDEGILDPPRAAAIALELAKTLVDLHGAGIIHRDLKPDNVLLAAPAADGHGETVKLIDFGLARPDDASRELTVADTILGTPSYMAAEQTGLDPSLGETGPATDLHGIGSLLFAMLTGHAPYEAASVMASLQRAVRGGVAGWERLDGVPGELRAIVKRCLRADPRQRYSSAAELAAHLSAFLDTGRPACRRSARNALLNRPKRGWRWTAAAMLPLALAACSSGSDSGGSSSPSPVNPSDASGTVVFWDTSDSTNEAPAFKDLIKKFEAAYPNVKVDYQNVPFSEAQNKYKTAAQADNAPDVLRAEVAWTPEFASLGYLLPLTGTALDTPDAYLPTPFSSNIYENVQYGVPQVTDAPGLMYNKELLQKAAGL